jgi:hypothetical protein
MKISDLANRIKLNEMPERIPNMMPNVFDEYESNIQTTKNLLKSKSLNVLQEYENGKFILASYENYYFLFCTIPDDAPKTVYYMEYEFHKIFGVQCVQQMQVWHDKTVSNIKIAKEVFFNHLLKAHHTIVTDFSNTKDGEIFWKNRIKDAFNLGLNVYFADTNSSNEFLKIKNENDFQELLANDSPWGIGRNYRNKFVVISMVKLKEMDND